MTDRLPPLKALHAFEAAARHMSFQKAAKELHVTPAALSYQIKLLESSLSVKLFVRKTRAVALTAAGESLYPDVKRGFGSFADGIKKVTAAGESSALVVSAGPAITTKWLIPRIGGFTSQHADIDLRLSTSIKSVDFDTDDVDVAIRHGDGNYPGLAVTWLFGEAYTPLCAPALLETVRADLSGVRLIFDDSMRDPSVAPGWNEWVESAGLDQLPDTGSSLRFTQADHAIQAAVDGDGVLLARMTLAATDIASKRLVQPFEHIVQSRYGYYFVTAANTEGLERVGLFKAWIMDEAKSVNRMLDSLPIPNTR